MDKKEATHVLHRVYRLLGSNEVPVILKKIRATRGETDSETIWLNPRLDILPTLIHECLHVFHWDWNETKVERTAVAVFHQLSTRQINNLLFRLSNAINNC